MSKALVVRVKLECTLASHLESTASVLPDERWLSTWAYQAHAQEFWPAP
jgi:hypothetical protein